MKKLLLLAFSTVLSSILFADGVDQLNMGIGEDNVFSDATPSAFAYPDNKAGKSELLPIAYSTIPPQIPHTIEKYLPITVEENACTDCHDKQGKIGKTERKTGKKIPMPMNHYGGFNGKGDAEEVSGSRYTCTQCHVPLSGAKPLVENTFQK
ncbi:MAG: nitrate reductase cytochrome c-type subunit [Cocleimonas sp.]